MKKDILNVKFIAAVLNKMPGKTHLANYLVEILQIEKEAVYRRLRNEVPFTFSEIARIAENINLSLDSILGIAVEEGIPFNLVMHGYDIPTNHSLNTLNSYLEILKILKRDPNSRVYETWNSLPFHFCYAYEYLMKFYLFRFQFLLKNATDIKFSKMTVDPNIREMQQDYLSAFKHIGHGYFILDNFIFDNLLKEIQYFYSGKYINKKEAQKILDETLGFIDELESMANSGKYKETGNAVTIYQSNMLIDTNYSVLESINYTLTLIRTLILNSASSSHQQTAEDIKKHIESFKASAVCINTIDEDDKQKYFNSQRTKMMSLFTASTR